MRSIGVTKFRAQCPAILDSLEPEGIVVTKRGVPMARVTPVEQPSADLIGALKGRIVIKGETGSTGTRWEAAE